MLPKAKVTGGRSDASFPHHDATDTETGIVAGLPLPRHRLGPDSNQKGQIAFFGARNTGFVNRKLYHT